MKVLVFAPPLGSTGGIQRYSACLVRALGDLLGQQNVRCVAIPEPTNGRPDGRFSASLKLRFAWQALAEHPKWRPDLIICTHVALGPLGRLLGGLARRPYWIILHGIEAWSALPYWKDIGLHHADRLITTSEFSRSTISKCHGIAERNISLLPCALDDSLLEVELSTSTIAGAIPAGSRVVLTVARMASSECYKGHDVVLRALPSVMAKIPNLIYTIVGEGDDRPRLERLAEELGLARSVVFTGKVTDAELAGLYRQSEVFLLPARTVIDGHNPKGEGFGIVYLEAMAFGKPVVGPNCGAPAEIIRHAEHGLLVDPEDPAAVARALLSLLMDPDRAQQMGQAGRDWAHQNCSYQRFRNRLSDLLSLN